MNDTEITEMIRRFIGEEQATYVSPEFIEQAKDDAMIQLGDILVKSAPEHFEKKVSIGPSNTNIHRFDMPSDLLGLKMVWDYGSRAGTISDAADNGSGGITLSVDSDFAELLTDGDIVAVHDVGGTTEANGTWSIDYDSGVTFDLVGPGFSHTYTSGGRVFIEKEDTYKYPMEREPARFEKGESDTKYHYKTNGIIVGDTEFDNDIIILYRYLPTTLDEIPPAMHFGIYAFGAIVCMLFPDQQVLSGGALSPVKGYLNLKKNYDLAVYLWEQAKRMAGDFRPGGGMNLGHYLELADGSGPLLLSDGTPLLFESD